MNKAFKISTIAIIAVALILSGSACTKSPEKVMRKMLRTMALVKSYNLDMKLGIHGQFPQLTSLTEETALLPGSVIFGLLGDVDMRNKAGIQYNLNAKVDYRLQDSEINFVGDLRSKDNTLYFRLSEVPELKVADLASLKNNWYRFDLKTLGLKESLLEEEVDQSNIDNFRKLVRETDFFEVVADHGIDEINSTPVHHYEVKIDQEAFANFFQEMNQATEGRDLTDLEKEELNKTLANWGQFTGDVWVGVDDYLLYRIELAGQQETLDGVKRYDLALQLSEFNKEVAIETPPDVRPFDFAKLFLPAFDSWLPELDEVDNGDITFEKLMEIEGADEEAVKKQLEEIQAQGAE